MPEKRLKGLGNKKVVIKKKLTRKLLGQITL